MTATSTTQTAATTNAPVPQKNQTKSERIAALHAANMARKAEAAKNVVNGTTAPKAALRDEADKAAAEFAKSPRKNRGHKHVPLTVGIAPPKTKDSDVDPFTAGTAARRREQAAEARDKVKAKAAPTKAKRTSKAEGAMADAVAKLASRKEGATRAELEALTGWKRAGWPWLFYNKQTGRGIAPSRGLKLVITKRPGADGKPGRTAYCLVKA